MWKWLMLHHQRKRLKPQLLFKLQDQKGGQTPSLTALVRGFGYDEDFDVESDILLLWVFKSLNPVPLTNMDIYRWKVVDPLPSYGRGIDLTGQRYLLMVEQLGKVSMELDNKFFQTSSLVYLE